mmetsp:Transcript_89802/g.155463  ORF Transcript_89802/g.155463 Transcript_89802/m.155463 type:complete len:369 (-) Transcript_89802:14-1120(-)
MGAEGVEIRFEACAADADSLAELHYECWALPRACAPDEVSVNLSIGLAELSIRGAGLSRHSFVLVPSAVVALDACRLKLRGAWPVQEFGLRFDSADDASKAAASIKSNIQQVAQSLYLPLQHSSLPMPPRSMPLPASAGECLASGLLIYTPPPGDDHQGTAAPVFELRCVDVCVPFLSTANLWDADGQGLSWPTMRVYKDHRRAELLDSIGLGTYCRVLFDDGSHSLVLQERLTHRLAFVTVEEAAKWAELLQLVCSLNPVNPQSFVDASAEIRSKAEGVQACQSPQRWPQSPSPSTPLLRRLGPSPSCLPDNIEDPFAAAIAAEEADSKKLEGFDVEAVLVADAKGSDLPRGSDTCSVRMTFEGTSP